MTKSSKNILTRNLADEPAENSGVAIALQPNRHLRNLEVKARRLEKARRRMAAYYLAKALKKIQGKTSQAEFSAFIREYHTHFSISLQYHEKPMPPSDFYREWTESRGNGRIPMDPDKEPLYRAHRYQVYESPKGDWGTWSITNYAKQKRSSRN